jgi:hypothetical protein
LNTLVARGRYLARFGQHERAVRAYQQALALDPSFRPAQQLLAESTKAVGK